MGAGSGDQEKVPGVYTMILGLVIVLMGIGRATLSTNSYAINPVTTKSERRHGRMAVEVALTAILSLKVSLAKSCGGGRSGAWNMKHECSVLGRNIHRSIHIQP